MNSDTDDDDSDLETIQLVGTGFINDQHIRIANYVERVVPNYTNREFQEHFRFTIPAFEFLQRTASQSQLLENYSFIQINKQLLSFVWLLANQESFR
jgi:hypothetical protein